MNCLSITFVKVLENYHWPQVLLCYWGLRTSFVTLIDWLILKISIITPPKEGREISRLKLLKNCLKITEVEFHEDSFTSNTIL